MYKLRRFETEAEYSAATLNYPSVSWVVSGDTVHYDKTAPTPTGSTCYEIISTPITSYTSTTYDSVYSWSDAKWYMKNNLSQYEEYGIYDIVENISSATTYNGKLAVVGTTEYEYSGGSWVVVGTYEDASTTYEITDEDPYEYEGVELSTTFKIPYADVEAVGFVDLIIRTQDGGNLEIRGSDYYYMGDDIIRGTVTNDNNYYYYELPDIDSVVIETIDYDSTPIHLIVGSKQASVEYFAKTAPSSALTYSSIADMEAVSCPTVGVGQYCYTNGQVYKYTSNYEWITVQDSELMIKSFNANGEVSIMGCGYNNGEAKNGDFVSGATDIWLGSCITSVNNIWRGLYDTLSAVTFTATNPPTYTSISNLPNNLEIKVPCNSVHSYRTSNGWTNINNIITSYEPNCETEINYRARFYGADDSLLGVIHRNPNNSGNSITYHDAILYTLTAYRVEFGDCFNIIGDGAFSNFTHIQEVIIPNNVVNIYANAFKGCTSLRSLTIGNGTRYINSGMCSGCTSLTSVDIPNSVTSIGSHAFRYCISLANINIPSSVTAINNTTFGNCSGLTSITIPNSVTYIGNNAIQHCTSLSSITIPSSVTSIGQHTFYGCSGLTSITCNATTPPTLASTNAFDSTNNCPIYVPAESVDAYKAANNWSTYASRIQAIQ